MRNERLGAWRRNGESRSIPSLQPPSCALRPGLPGEQKFRKNLINLTFPCEGNSNNRRFLLGSEPVRGIRKVGVRAKDLSIIVTLHSAGSGFDLMIGK